MNGVFYIFYASKPQGEAIAAFPKDSTLAGHPVDGGRVTRPSWDSPRWDGTRMGPWMLGEVENLVAEDAAKP